MDEDRILDDNSHYGKLQILRSVVLGVQVGLIFYLLTLPITFCGFAYLAAFDLLEFIKILLLLLLAPGVGGLIGGYIGYGYGLGIRLCTSIGAFMFSLLLIIKLFFFS